MNCSVPVARASLFAYTSESPTIMYTGSSVKCAAAGYYGYDDYISPAPTYSWRVSTISTDLHFGPNSNGYLETTRDMIGRTTFTCTASNTIRGITYSATSDPLTIVIMNIRDDIYTSTLDIQNVTTSNPSTAVTMNIQNVTYSPTLDPSTAVTTNIRVRDITYTPTSDHFPVVTMNIQNVTNSPTSDLFIMGKYFITRHISVS